MEPEFWHSKWQEKKIGFHLVKVNPLLLAHLPSLHLQIGDTVFVPLCGKSLDMLYLLSAGINVVGVELSPIAVADFFTESGLLPTKITSEHSACQGYMATYHEGNVRSTITLWCGDMFHLPEDAKANIAKSIAIYDRAAIIAMPNDTMPSLRHRYIHEIKTLAPTVTRQLIITIEYPQAERKGPPFAVFPHEIHEAYSEDFNIEKAEELTGEAMTIQLHAVSSTNEVVWILTRKK